MRDCIRPPRFKLGREQRDRKKQSPMTLDDDHHTQYPCHQMESQHDLNSFVNRYTMQRCTISCLRDPR